MKRPSQGHQPGRASLVQRRPECLAGCLPGDRGDSSTHRRRNGQPRLDLVAARDQAGAQTTPGQGSRRSSCRRSRSLPARSGTAGWTAAPEERRPWSSKQGPGGPGSQDGSASVVEPAEATGGGAHSGRRHDRQRRDHGRWRDQPPRSSNPTTASCAAPRATATTGAHPRWTFPRHGTTQVSANRTVTPAPSWANSAEDRPVTLSAARRPLPLSAGQASGYHRPGVAGGRAAARPRRWPGAGCTWRPAHHGRARRT